MTPAAGRTRRRAGAFLAALALFTAVLSAAPPEAEAQSVNVCSRTAEVVARIRQALSLPSWECSADPGAITGTFIVRNLTSLKSGDFDGMSGVTNLFFSQSSGLTSLPASPFDEMTSLTSLLLTNTGLTSLPTGTFDNLDGLTRILLPRLFTLDVKAEQHRGGVRARIDEAAPLPVTVTWTASGGGTSGTATIAAGERTSAVFGASLAEGVTVTLSNPSFSAGESTSDTAGSFTNFQLGVAQSAASATTPPAEVALELSPASISEGGGVATVSAVLSRAVSEAVTVTLAATPGSGTAAADFTLSGTMLTIAAGASAATGPTITAVNNDVQAADKSVTVSGTASGGGVSGPSAVTLTITDNDSGLPTGAGTTWRGSHGFASGWDVTTSSLLGKTSAQPISMTVNVLGGSHILVCARRTVTQPTTGLTSLPVDRDGCRQPNPRGTALTTITLTQAEIDNDGVVIIVAGGTGGNQGFYYYAEWVPIVALPRATMTLTASSISESGSSNVSTVTATLDKGALSAATITIEAAPADDVTLSVAGTPPLSALRFAAGATASTTTVRITAVNDDVDAPDKSVTISGNVAGDVKTPSPLTLAITDDEVLPTVTLELSPGSISEDGGVSSVTATLSGKSSEAVTVTVGAAAGTGAVGADFTLSDDKTLTIAAGTTTSTGDVTVRGNDNDVDSPNKSVTVSATVTGGNGVVAPADVTLTLEDDENLPTVTLALSPASIAEDGGAASVTATLSGKSSEAVTVTVGAAAGAGAVGADFTLSDDKTLTIAAGSTTSTGPVTVTANGNDRDSPDKSVTVSGTVTGGNGVLPASDVTLTLTDNEDLPVVALVLSPASVSENGGVSSVTATLSGKSSEAVTVTVGAAEVTSTGAVAADFDLSTANTLTIAAGSTTSTGDVTVTANDNTVSAAHKQVTVSGTAAGGNDVLAPSNVTLTITDDEDPVVTLVLTPASISESGGATSVTATLNRTAGAAVTVTVGAAAGTGAVAADFTLSGATKLTIAAGNTTSTGDVTVTANGNDVDSPDKSVTVSGTVASGDSVTAPANVTLTLEDDEDLPTVTLALAPASISEDGGVASVTATLSGASSDAVTVTVDAAAVTSTGAVAADFTLSDDKTLTIAAGATASTGDVTVTANDNDRDVADKSVTVSGTVTGGNGVLPPADVTLTLTDDDTVGLTFNPSTITVTEQGAGKKVAVSLDTEPPGTAWIGLHFDDGLTVNGGLAPSGFSYSFTPTTWQTPLTVTVGASGDADHEDETLYVRYAVSGYGPGNVADTPGTRVIGATVNVTDDDKPVVTLALSPASIGENGGVASVTATLDRTASEATTVTVGAAAGTGAVDGDFTLSEANTLTIAAGATTSTGDVTVTANDNDTDAPDKQVTVSATVEGGDGAAAPDDVTLTLTDDDAAPGVTLSLVDSSIAENGGATSVSAVLDRPSSAVTTVTVSAVSGFYTVGSDATVVIAAGDTTAASDMAGIAAVDDDVHQGTAGRSTTVTATAVNAQAAAESETVAVTGPTLTLTDDETRPTAALALTAASIDESGASNVTTVTATLSGKSSEAVTLTVSAAPGARTDFDLSTAKTLTIAAGATTSTGDVTITARDDLTDSLDKSVTVSATAVGGNGVAAPPDLTLTITDDEDLPTVTLVLTPTSVSESGGVSSVTATLSGKSSAAVTVTVGAAEVTSTGAVAADFTLSEAKTLTIGAGSTTSAGDVTVTANGNDVDAPDKSVTVSGSVTGGNGVMAPSDVTLTLEDDEDLPTVTLVLTPSSISETNGESSVTATLSGKSSEAVTVTVGAAAGTNAVAADFDLSTAKTLTIAAGATASSGDVTVTANGNDVDSPDKSVTVSGTVRGGNGAVNPENVTLTLEDDEDLPTVTLALSASSISENGGETTVTATLSGKSSEAVTVTVGAAEVTSTGAVAADFTLSTAKTLTIAAGDTASTGDVTVRANDNTVSSAQKQVTVSGTVMGGNNVVNPSSLTLTITDDDAPLVTLALSAASISENGGVSSVTASLSAAASEATTVTVGAAAGTGAVDGDFTLSDANTLTIAAGATASTGDVTVTAVDNETDAPDKQVTVSATVMGGDMAVAPDDVTLTLTDDDPAPGVTLSLVDSSIAENGGATSVSAVLDRPSSAVTTVTVSAVSGFYTVGSDATVVIAAGDTTAASDMAGIAAVDDDVHQGTAGRSTTVTATAVNAQAAAESETVAVTGVTLALTDDETLPTVALVLTPTSISETNGETSVTATLSGKSSEAVTVTVGAAAGTGAVAADFDLSTAKTLTIAAGATTSTGDVTVTANGNDTDSPNKSVTVSGSVTGGNNVSAPSSVTLTLEDDEDLPTVTLVLTPASVSESGGVSSVTATLSGKSSEAVTVTVGAAAGTGAVGADFTLSGANTLTIAAGDTTSTGDVTVTANGNDRDSPDKSVTVSGTVTGGNNVAAPSNVTLTLEDDDATPAVTLVLTPASVTESGGVSSVTATLASKSGAAVTVTVGAAAGTNAAAADFTLSGAKTLTIAAGATTSTGDVTVTANGNDTDSPDKSVTVSGTVTGGHGLLSAPSNVALTLTDDDPAPGVTLSLVDSSIAENGGATSVSAVLDRPSSAVTTVTVTAVSGFYTVGSDATVVIAAGATTAASDMAGIAAVNDDVHQGTAGRSTTVTATAANDQAAAESETVAVTGATLALTDDEGLPTVTLVLTPTSISETNGESSVTATLSGKSSEAVTVTVGAAAGTGAVAADFDLSTANTLTIAAGATTSTGDVTVTANGNDTDSPNKSVTVSGTVTGGNNVSAPSSVTLTLTDDEVLPTVTLVLTPASVSESGGESSVTATLSGKSSEAVTVTVGAAAGTGAVGADFDLSTAKTLTIAAGDTTSSGDVTVRANGNDRDSPDKSVTVSGTVMGGNGVLAPTNVTLTLEDDDATPTVALVLTPASVTESGGMSSVTATLSSKSGAAVTVTVGAAAGTGAVGADFTLSGANTLTIAAGQTTSTGDVTVTANGNDVDSPDKSVTVSGTVTGGHGLLSAPSNRTLTLTDDETLPTVTLVLTPTSVSETNGESSVTATLSGKSSEAVTVTVGAAAGAGAVAADFTLSGAKTLTIAAGDTTSTGDVTVTANGNDRDSPDKSVTVSGTVTGGNGAAAPSNRTLTLTDDDATPTVTLVLTPASVSESGGVSSVTATLSSRSGAAVTVTVGAAAGTNAAAADFTLSGAKTLTIAAGDTTSTGDVTVTANGNDTDSPNKSVTVSGTVTGGHGLLSAPSNRTLTLTDDEVLPTVALVLTPTSVSESGGVSSVTATLSGKSSEAVTVTVGAAAGTNAVAADFTLSGAKTLTIAAGSTTSTGAVTVTANPNTVDSPDKSVTVSSTAVTGGNGVVAPTNRTLTLEDDDVLPTATLALSAATIDESGSSNETTVTATLNHGSSEALTITVSVSPVTSTGAVAGDYRLSSANTLTIAAGATTSSGTVTVSAVDNANDEPDIQVTVSGSAAGGRGVASPGSGILTIRDDEGPPLVTLALSPASIAESGASNSAAVTATLNRASSAVTTVTVSTAPGTNAAAGDYMLSSAYTLTIAAGATTSTGTVTVTAADNDTDAPDKQVTVSGTAVNTQGIQSPLPVTLTITDDEAAPTVTLSVASSTIPENAGSTTVRAALSHRSSAVTTVTVTAVANAYTVASGAGATIVIAAGQTVNASDTATITAVNNAVDAADNAVTVTGMATNTQGVGAVTGASLTITDDDTAGLTVSPSSVTSSASPLRTTEPSGTNTFTVALATRPTGNVVLGVASSDQTEGRPSPSSLTFTTTNWNTAQTVTVTGQDDTAADGNVDYTISLTVNQGSTADGVYDLLSAVTVHAVNADDEYGLSVGTVTGQATEAGGQATFTVRLLTQPSAAVTVAVSSRDASEGRVSPSSLVFGTGNWNVDRTVTVTGLNDDVDDGDVAWQVRLDPASGGSGGDSNYHALAHVDVNVTTTDDDAAPTVRLALSPASISENGGTAAVRATLNRASVEATTVTVTAVSGLYTVGSGAAETIVIPAGQTANASDTATITAVNDDVHQGATGRSTTVTATAANGMGVGAVTGAALRLNDDEAAPGVTLSLSGASIPENGGTSVVSAVLSGESAAATTVTVTAVSGAYSVGSDATIVIAAGDTTAASDTVTITAVDNTTDEPNRTATVTATLANSRGAGSVTGVTLTLEDNDAAPTATLLLASSSIPENGGSTTVRARLSNPSSHPTTVTVTAVANAYTVASGAGATIIVAAGATTSADTATITAVDNAVDAADNVVTVAGTAANGQAAAESQTVAVTGASLTIADDDTAGFAVSPSTSASSRLRTSEDRSQARFTVALATEPTGNVVLAVASSDTGEGTVSPPSLTFTAANWNTAQTVTLTGVDDSPTPSNPNPAAGRRPYTVTLTVQGSTADGRYGVLGPVRVHAVNVDDEYGLELGEVTGQATEGGGSATFTVALVTQPSAAVTVSVTSRDGGEGRVSPSSLTFTTSNWDTPQRVTATGVDDAIDDGDVTWQLRLDPSSGDANYDGLDDEDVSVTTRDDDDAPTVTLALTPSTIDEGGTANTVATVTAMLSHPSGARTTVTVAATAVAPALADDFALSTAATLTIAAEATASTGQVTVTAVDNDVDAPDKQVRVTAAEVANDRAAADSTTMAVTGATLTVVDDDEKGLAFAPAEFLAVTAGGSTAYTVALTSEPTGEVTVTPATQADVTLAPPSLTFTAADWRTAQTVTVKAEAYEGDGYADAAAPFAHGATGGGYADVTGEISLAVEDGATVAVEQPGTNDYGIEGRRVTVTVEDGTPAGIEIDLTGLGAGEPLTVTISPDVAAETVAQATRDGYGLGPEAMRTVVDIAVSDAPSSGVRICLPVADETREAARTRSLLLLHYDGSRWTRVAGAEETPDGAMICAPEVVSFSPFAVGYEDTRPEFVGQDEVCDQNKCVWTVDEPIDPPVDLPEARGGDGTLTYALEPEELPDGFDRAWDGHRRLSGTPTEEFAERRYVWTATDVDGQTVKSPPFTIEVVAAVGPARARLKKINESILPEVSRASWDSWMAAVTGRLVLSGAGGAPGAPSEGLAAALARFAQSNEQALEDDASWKEMLSGQSFVVGLGGEGEGAGAGTGFGKSVTVWGAGDRRRLSRDVPSLAWSGDLSAFHLGADVGLDSGLTGGVGVSWYESRMDYVDRSEDEAIGGVHRSRMASVQPYVGWSSVDGSRLWASVGYGSGEVEIDDEDLRERFGRQESDSEFMAAAAGGAVRVASAGAARVDLKGEGQVTRYEVDENGDLIEGLSVETRRVRVSAEGSREYVLDGGGRMTPTVELGVRWDGGDGATGAGGEVGGGLSWNGPGRLALEVAARWLVAHHSAVEEWGLSGGVRFEPRANGRGLSLSVQPAWGEAGSGMSRLWEDGVAVRGEAADERSGAGAALEAEVGYGVSAFEGFGVATPYTRFGLAQEGERRYGLGWRLSRRSGDAFALDLGVWRRERDTARPEHGVSLDLRLRW